MRRIQRISEATDRTKHGVRMEGVEDEVGDKLSRQATFHRIPIVTMIRCYPNPAI